ncbi:hypothetical protein F5Y16DRAFT_81808 [Xylariaceae sp. FL0255]|nr:hypothetical protein F5Y16DRAFT_81808 [Xylariaceae sp. FL0255]
MAKAILDLLSTASVAVISHSNDTDLDKRFTSKLGIFPLPQNLWLVHTNPDTAICQQHKMWIPVISRYFTPDEHDTIRTAIHSSKLQLRVQADYETNSRKNRVRLSEISMLVPSDTRIDPIKAMQAELRKRLPGLCIGISEGVHIDIIREPVDTHHLILKLCQLTSIPVTNTIFFGKDFPDGSYPLGSYLLEFSEHEIQAVRMSSPENTLEVISSAKQWVAMCEEEESIFPALEEEDLLIFLEE